MNRVNREGRRTNLIGALLFLLSFSTYTLTLCPTVYWYDSGELISACFHLGIAHPTGYPLYTVLGRVFSLLPFGNPALRVNVMSAFFGALTVVVIYKVITVLLEIIWKEEAPHGNKKSVFRIFEFEAPAIVASLTFAFCPLFWNQTVITEVYTLHTFLIGLLIFSLLYWMRWSNVNSRYGDKGNSSEDAHAEERLQLRYRFFYLFGFLLGLSLCHHLTILLFVPAFLTLIVAEDIRTLKNTKILMTGLLFFLIGISVNMYLLIRARLDPIQNWGDPGTWNRFIDVVTGLEIRARPTRYAPHSIGELWTLLGRQFLWPGIALGGVGIFSTIRRKKSLFVFFALFFVGMVLYILRNYDFLEDQYLPVFLVFALWVGLGAKEITSSVSRLFSKSEQGVRTCIVGTMSVLFISLPVTLFAVNYSSMDKSHCRVAYTFGEKILEHLDDKAIFLSEGSNIPLLLDYVQRVEGIRPDVVNIYLFVLEFDWYRKQLAHRFPEISIPILPDNRVHRLIEQNVSSHTIYYVPFSKEPNVDIGRLIPRGFHFHIQPERTIPSTGEIREHFSIQDRFYNAAKGPLDEEGKDILAQLHGTMGLYFERIGLDDEAYKEYTKALEIDSLNPGVHYDLGSLAMARGDFKEAIQDFQKVLEIEPSNINTRYEIVQCYSQTGQLVQALREMENIVRADPNEPLFHINLGTLYGQVGKTELAIEQFTKALEYDPDNADILHNLGITEARSGHPDMAIRHLKRAEQKDPNDIEIMYALASSYAEKKDYGNSERYFQKILKLGGPNPTVLADLGHLYLESGSVVKAIETWEAALTLDPGDAHLRNELNHLRERMMTNVKPETGDRKPN